MSASSRLPRYHSSTSLGKQEEQLRYLALDVPGQGNPLGVKMTIRKNENVGTQTLATGCLRTDRMMLPFARTSLRSKPRPQEMLGAFGLASNPTRVRLRLFGEML